MESIPVATPIISPQPIIAEPLSQPLIPSQEPTFQSCRTCKQLFHRDESNKMTSHYFRCHDCIDKQVSRAVLTSCILQ